MEFTANVKEFLWTPIQLSIGTMELIGLKEPARLKEALRGELTLSHLW